MPSPSTHSEQPTGIGQLTFLRFIAAMGVLVFHDGREVAWLQWGLPLWNVSNTAVSFFFFLSGFVLTYVYQDRPRIVPRTFYAARLARIAPVYWLALLGVSLLAAKNGDLSVSEFLLSATLLQAWVPGFSQVLNGPGWSLSVEVFFYLLFPFLLPLLKRLKTPRRLLIAFGSIWLLNLGLHMLAVENIAQGEIGPRLTDAVYFHPIGHLGTFVLGIVGGLLYRHVPRGLTRWAPTAMLLSVGGFLALVWWGGVVLNYHHNGLFVPLFAVFVIALGHSPNTALSRVFSSPLCTRLGEISYGVYILQDPLSSVVLAVTTRLGDPLGHDAHFVLYALVLLGFAYVSFRVFEEPARRHLRRRWM